MNIQLAFEDYVWLLNYIVTPFFPPYLLKNRWARLVTALRLLQKFFIAQYQTYHKTQCAWPHHKMGSITKPL